MTRDAAAIGAGLAPARPARPIPAGQRLHVIGVAGAGASAAALLAHHAGALVTGCDAGGASPYTPPLEEAGVRLDWQHSADHITSEPVPDRVAVTKALTAVHADHPELRAAIAAGIPLESWQQAVADAAVGRTLVGVAGTHGKSTTAGWLVHVLVNAGLDPAAFVGALLPSPITGGLPSTARTGRGAPFVVEADEYAGNFDPYRPDLAVLTSAEWDHPDVFANSAAVIDAFATWLGRMPDGGTIVANAGDPGVEAVLDRVIRDRPLAVVAYALTEVDPARGGYLRGLADRFGVDGRPATPLMGRITSADREGTTLEIHGLDSPTGPVVARLSTAGRHNAANALAVAGAAMSLGVPADRDRLGARVLRGRRTPPGAQGRGGRCRGLRRLRPPPHRHPRDAHGDPAARTGSARVGGVRAVDVPSNGRPPARLRRRARDSGRGGRGGHLGRSRPGHHGRLRRRPRAGRGSGPARDPGRGPRLGRRDRSSGSRTRSGRGMRSS